MAARGRVRAVGARVASSGEGWPSGARSERGATWALAPPLESNRGDRKARDVASAPVIGTTLGPYRIDRELGSGGMGTVWRAIGADGVAVAIKVVHPHLLATRDFRERFDREAHVGLAIRHPNVVATIACLDVESGGKPVPALVLEYVEGRSLVELLAELGRVPEDLCRHLAREIARGLDAIHAAGIVHRDLKPGNVLITPGHDVKVMDLGLARSVSGDDRLSSTGVFVGTAAYAPPEQFRGAQTLDPRSDLYSLGAMLFELATGEVPFRADSIGDLVRQVLNERPRRPGTLAPQLSPFFEELLLQLLAKSPAERFASALELGEILDAGERSSWWIDASSQATKLSKRPSRRIRIPRATAMWGREKELADLVVAWEAAKAGDGRVVLLEGETGIGKSRLVEELLACVETEDAHVVVGGYPPGGAATASGAFTTAFREHFGAEGVEEGLRAHLRQTPVLIPAFAALLRGETTPAGAEPLTKDSLQTCFVHATRSLASEKPLVVVIDDLHFAPEEGRSLFAALALAVPGHRVLLVGTARPGLPAPWIAELERLAHVTRSAVRRLDEEMVRTQLTSMLGTSPGAEDLAGRIASKSGGNPFFVFEILRSLRESGHLTQTADGAWRIVGRATAVDIPSTVKDLVAARLGALAEQDREVLEVAACHGFEFDGRLVAEALGRPRLDVLRRLGRVERETSLVRAVGARFVFDHHAVHETLYGGMPQSLREEIHAAVGGALERTSGAAGKDAKDLDGALAVEICEQFVRSAEAARGVRYLDAALTHMERRYLNDAAIRLAQTALGVQGLLTGADRGRLLVRLADGPLDRLGLRAQQEAAACEAEHLAEAAGDEELGCKASTTLGFLFLQVSRLDEAEARFRRASESARSRGDNRSEARAATGSGNVLGAQGRLAEARERLERALALNRSIGNRRGEGSAMMSLGHVFHHERRLAEARAHYEGALSCLGGIVDRRDAAIINGSLGNVLESEGRHPEAADQYERTLAIFRETGSRLGEARVTMNLGVVRKIQGRLEDARELLLRARAICREIGDRSGEASATGNLGAVLFWQGRLVEARVCFEKQLSMAHETKDMKGEAIALHNLGLVLAEEGDFAGAMQRQLDALALSEKIGDRSRVAWTLLSIGSVRERSGESGLARESFETAWNEASRNGAVEAEAMARCHHACLTGEDAKGAQATLMANDERLEFDDRLKSRFLLWRATGERAHLVEAKRFLDEAVANVPDDIRSSMLANLRVNREVAAAAKAAGL